MPFLAARRASAQDAAARDRCYHLAVVFRSPWLLVLCLVVLGACQRTRQSEQKSRLTDCLAAQVVFLTRLQAGDSVDHETLACEDLYQEASCGNAWHDVLRQAATFVDGGEIRIARAVPDLAPVVGPCTKAYCPQLSAPLPALCNSPAPTDNAALVDAVQALDVAILKHDLADPRAATALGWKANVFRHVTVSLAKPLASIADSPPPVFAVEMLPGEIWINREHVSDDMLLVRARRACAENPETRAVLRADGRVPHGEVVRVIDQLKRAGIAKIAFAVAPNAPAASASAAAP